jgi:hypothetical protein
VQSVLDLLGGDVAVVEEYESDRAGEDVLDRGGVGVRGEPPASMVRRAVSASAVSRGCRYRVV